MFDFERFLKNNSNGTMGVGDDIPLVKNLRTSPDNTDFAPFYNFVETVEIFSAKDGTQKHQIFADHCTAKPAVPE